MTTLVSAIIEAENEPSVPFQGQMRTLDRTGDTKTTWDRRRPEEVKAARATFDALKEKGYIAFHVKKDGSKGELMSVFDPEAEMVIMSPAVVGG